MVNLRFLERTTFMFGFPKCWASQVMACVSTASASAAWWGFDKETPFLLTSLSGKGKVADNLIKAPCIPCVGRSPPLLAFVDDVLFFSSASISLVSHLKEALRLFEVSVSLKINSNKSTMLFSPSTPVGDDCILQQLG